MAFSSAQVVWSRGNHAFTDNRYSRAHRWPFDGGVECPASSPQVVPLPFSTAQAFDPEEAFVASLSSCHMLWFLSIAAKPGYCVDRYGDEVSGEMGRNREGRTAMIQVVLNPTVAFSGARIPSQDEHEALHALAHHECFIANSVRTEVLCRPRIDRP